MHSKTPRTLDSSENLQRKLKPKITVCLSRNLFPCNGKSLNSVRRAAATFSLCQVLAKSIHKQRVIPNQQCSLLGQMESLMEAEWRTEA